MYAFIRVIISQPARQPAWLPNASPAPLWVATKEREVGAKLSNNGKHCCSGGKHWWLPFGHCVPSPILRRTDHVLYYFDHRFTACYTLPIQFTEVTIHSWLLPLTELNIVHDQTALIFLKKKSSSLGEPEQSDVCGTFHWWHVCLNWEMPFSSRGKDGVAGSALPACKLSPVVMCSGCSQFPQFKVRKWPFLISFHNVQWHFQWSHSIQYGQPTWAQWMGWWFLGVRGWQWLRQWQ